MNNELDSAKILSELYEYRYIILFGICTIIGFLTGIAVGLQSIS